MPYVVIRRNKKKVEDKMIELLRMSLRKNIANALSTPEPEGKLTEDDIEIQVLDLSPLDVSTKDLEIIIWAHDFLERRENLDERRDVIVGFIKKFLSEHSPDARVVSGFVWVLLSPTSFGEF